MFTLRFGVTTGTTITVPRVTHLRNQPPSLAARAVRGGAGG